MTQAQRIVLRSLNGYSSFPGYCELMADAGLKSYRAADWVLDALERRGLLTRDDAGEYSVTDAGKEALRSARRPHPLLKRT